MGNTLLKLDGFDIDEIRELLMMARNSLNITIFSLGEGSRISSDKFPKICKDNLPYLKCLNLLSSFTIESMTF
jgi:hypothetical protein